MADDRTPEDDAPTLKGLFTVCKDSEHGFRVAADQAGDAGLKATLLGYAGERARYAEELQERLALRGEHPARPGTIPAALHQGWAAIKSALKGGDDAALLTECARGEVAAREAYEEALTRPLSADARQLVGRQLRGVQEACDRLQVRIAVAR